MLLLLHIELQTFLNAPRRFFMILFVKLESLFLPFSEQLQIFRQYFTDIFNCITRLHHITDKMKLVQQ